MPKVYRLVDESGTGIYTSGLLYGIWELDYYYDDQNHPSPQKDSPEMRFFYSEKFDAEKHQFAFSSLKQLMEWFWSENDRKQFQEEGVKVVEYYVPLNSTFEGKRQLFFDKTKAKFLREVEKEKWL